MRLCTFGGREKRAPPLDYVEKRRVLLPFTFGDSHGRKGAENPIVDGSTIGLAPPRLLPPVAVGFSEADWEETTPPLDFLSSVSSPKVRSLHRWLLHSR